MRLFLCLLVVLFSSSAQASPVTGFWSGTATRGGETRPVTLHIEETPQGLSARYGLPHLTVEGMPLARFAFDAATGELTSGRSLQARLENGRISGALSPVLIHGGPVQIDLRRAEAPAPRMTREREVEILTRGIRLRGTLVVPQGAGPFPAMVSLHGSGASTRWLALGRARRFAEAGYAMLIFDKPGNGQSEGDWTVTSLDELAADAIAAVDFLRRQPEIRPDKVGLWGHSQAGQVISRAMSIRQDVDFVMVLAGGGVSSREIEDYGYLGRLRHAGASPESTEKAMAWVNDYYAYVETGQGYEALVSRLRTEADQEWVRALGVGTVYPTPVQQPKWTFVATYDPAEDIRRMRMPVLLLFAADDVNVPSERSLDAWRRGLAEGGNPDVESKMFPGAEHHFLTPAHTDGWQDFAPGYYETQIDWLNRNVGAR